MQEEQEDDICVGDPDSVLGRVRDIRRKWAVQEDEALAYKLQDEEIAQHYNSNRTRNAIVREDAPRAREAQRQEELQALEERLNHLSILQKQAEEDARLAKLLASKDTEGAKVKKHQHHPVSPNGNGHGHGHSRSESSSLSSPRSPAPSLSPQQEHFQFQQHVPSEVMMVSGPGPANLRRAQAHSPLLGAAAAAAPLPLPPVKLADAPGPSRSCLKKPAIRQLEYDEDDDFITEEDLRRLQEERDAAVAKALQEELDRTEKDKQLALEAQDRELAKMIHEKERARYRRAKEKARLKAEAIALERGETPEGSDQVIRASSRNSSSSERSRSVMSSVSGGAGDLVMPMPPKLPEKQRSPTQSDHLGFRAHPKPLPPHPPPVQEYSIHSHNPHPPPPLRLEQHQHHQRLDPVPPYMPIHGYNRNSPKRNK